MPEASRGPFCEGRGRLSQECQEPLSWEEAFRDRFHEEWRIGLRKHGDSILAWENSMCKGPGGDPGKGGSCVLVCEAAVRRKG